MTAAGDLENETKFKKRKLFVSATAKAPAVKPAAKVTAKPAAKPATKSAPVKSLPVKAAPLTGLSAVDLIEARALVTVGPPAKLRSKVGQLNPAKQRKAITAAKQSRVLRSGKTTRTLSHVKARGKRNQARRDAKN